MKSSEALLMADPADRIRINLKSEDKEDAVQRKSVFKTLQGDVFMGILKQIAWDGLASKEAINLLDEVELVSRLERLMLETSCREILENAIVRVYERNAILSSVAISKCGMTPIARTCSEEPLDFMCEVRDSWESGIREELLAVIKEAGRPFVITRPTGTPNPLLESEPISLVESPPGDDKEADRNAARAAPVDAPIAGGGQNASSLRDVRFLFDSEDLYEAVVAIVNPNMREIFVTDRMLGQIKVALWTPTVAELARKFSELSAENPQLGLDECSAAHGTRILKERHEEAVSILARHGPILEARKYLRYGVPHSLRGKMWRAAMGLIGGDAAKADEKKYFASLRASCDRLDMLTDTLFLKDVQIVTDDPRFFVFEDELKQIALCFSRDYWIFLNSQYVVHAPLLGHMELVVPAAVGSSSVGGCSAVRADEHILSFSNASHAPKVRAQSSRGATRQHQQSATKKSAKTHRDSDRRESESQAPDSDAYLGIINSTPTKLNAPPSGVQPFAGLSAYFAPSLYLYRDLPEAYFMCRTLYARIFCRLNVLSGDDGTLVHVCKLFEDLIISAHPRLFMHLMNIGLKPLQVALPWMQLGFVNLLELDQILILWDRIIGFMDTKILAVFAAAVFIFRSELLLSTASADDATAILSEGSRLKVIPLLQMFLFT